MKGTDSPSLNIEYGSKNVSEQSHAVTAEFSDRVREIAEARGLSESEVVEQAADLGLEKRPDKSSSTSLSTKGSGVETESVCSTRNPTSTTQSSIPIFSFGQPNRFSLRSTGARKRSAAIARSERTRRLRDTSIARILI